MNLDALVFKADFKLSVRWIGFIKLFFDLIFFNHLLFLFQSWLLLNQVFEFVLFHFFGRINNFSFNLDRWLHQINLEKVV